MRLGAIVFSNLRSSTRTIRDALVAPVAWLVVLLGRLVRHIDPRRTVSKWENMMELATLIARHARFRPDATAVVFGNERLTYAQFHARVARTANLLRSLGIGKGDKVATVLGNSREALELIWAVAAVGAALVPLSPLLMATGLATLLHDSDAKCLVSQRAMLPTLEAIRADLA